MPLRKTLERVRGSATSPNEETVKFTILGPVLRALGWDVDGGAEVAFEYSAGAESKGGRVDIALMNSKAQYSCVAFVEAKAPRVNLGDHVVQVLNYAFHSGVKVCVLTNGEEWWLYLPFEVEQGAPQDQRFAELNLLNDPIDMLIDDFQDFLGKEVLCNGEAERRAKDVLKVRRRTQLNIELPRIWQQMTDEPDAELVELVSKRVYKTVRLRPEPGQVADVLAAAPVRPSHASDDSASNGPLAHGSSQPAEPPQTRKRGKPARKPTGFVLWGQRHQVNAWNEVLIGVATALYERHPNSFEKLKERTRGRLHPLISSDESEIPEPKRIGTSGYWVNTRFSSKAIKKNADRLLENLGYNPSDLKLVFD